MKIMVNYSMSESHCFLEVMCVSKVPVQRKRRAELDATAPTGAVRLRDRAAHRGYVHPPSTAPPFGPRTAPVMRHSLVTQHCQDVALGDCDMRQSAADH